MLATEALDSGDLREFYKVKRLLSKNKSQSSVNAHLVLENDQIAASKSQKQAAFKQYFSKIMGGADASCANVLETFKKGRGVSPENVLQFIFDQLKSLALKTKPFTAPGFDGIRYALALYRLFPDILLPPIYSICTKSIQGDTPTQWLGSKLHPLYKNKGSLHSVENFRDILLTDTSGKLFKRFLRSQCVPYLDDYVLDSMCGGFRRRGVDFCSHFIRSRRSIAEVLKHSFASLFLDVKSAFASVLREFAMHDNISYTDSEICCLFERFGFSYDIFNEFVDNFKNAPALSQANVPDCVSEQIAPYFFDTFFSIDDSSECVIYKTGTGAGTPIADLMFTFIIGRVLRKCEERLKENDLLDSFKFADTGIMGPLKDFEYFDLGASYVDDCVFYATDSSPQVCVDKNQPPCA